MDSLFFIDTQPSEAHTKLSAWDDPEDVQKTENVESSYNFGKHHIFNNIQPKFKAHSRPTAVKCPNIPLKLLNTPSGLLICSPPHSTIKYNTNSESFEKLLRPLNSSSIISINRESNVVLKSKKFVRVVNISLNTIKQDIKIADAIHAEIILDKMAILKRDGTVRIFSLVASHELRNLQFNSPIIEFHCAEKMGYIYGITAHSIFSLEMSTMSIRELPLQEGTRACSLCITKSGVVVGYVSGCITIHQFSNFESFIETSVLHTPIDKLTGDTCSDHFALWSSNSKGSLRIVTQEGNLLQIPELKFKKIVSSAFQDQNTLLIGTQKCEIIWHCISEKHK